MANKKKKGGKIVAAFDGRASTRRQEVNIEMAGVKLQFVVKGLGAYESDQITQKYATLNALTGRTQFDMNKFADYRFEIFKKILVEAPFELTDTNIKDVDAEVALKILDAVGLGPAAIEGRKNLSRR